MNRSITIPTQAYDPRRFKAPWVAVCDFSKKPNGELAFQTWIGDPGDAGLLLVPNARPGMILATGQRDMQAESWLNTPTFYEVGANMELIPLPTRAAAFQRFHHNNQPKP